MKGSELKRDEFFLVVMKTLYIIFDIIIYSFLGWCCEVIYCYIIDHKFTNRGFLNGPLCPVYGFGAFFVLTFLDMYKSNKY